MMIGSMLPRGQKAIIKTVAILGVLFLLVGCGKDSIVNPRLGPTADFSATPLSGDQPLDVTFTDLSIPGTSGIQAWFWDFGDGTTSTLQNVGHLYGSTGIYNVSLRVTTDDGTDVEIKTDYITVTKAGQLPPNAAFIGVPTTGGPGTPVQFTDQSSPGSAIITTWQWDFGDGGTSTSRNPSHTYTASGSYTVSLSVTSLVGTDTETKTDYIVLAPTKPTAAFGASPTAGQTPFNVTFTDQSLTGGNPITARLWTFGDGSTDTTRNPVHLYTTPGTYTVTLSVTNAAGSDLLTRTNLITATAGPVPPTAAFSGTPTSGSVPLTVQFTDETQPGTSPITNRLWDFGDPASGASNTSTAQNPSHIYTLPGNYTVSLQVQTAVGEDTESKLSYIQTSPAPVAPTVDFSANLTAGVAPFTVTFTDLSINGGAPITGWAWDFGDGGTSTLQNPTHIYSTEGTFTVSLTATNLAGTNGQTKNAYITVGHVAVPPVAAFVGAPTSGDAPLTVNFTDQSTPGSAPITTHLWDFGDGSTSTATSPSHTYANPGSYTVVLTVSTADGNDTENKGFYIQVSVPPTAPTAAFTGNPTVGFIPLVAAFTDQSTNGGSPITAWSWAFGDGGTSTLQNPGHTYVLPDTYTVTLTVTNAVGSDSEIKTDYIIASIVPVPPVANFTGTPTSGDAPLTVNFTDTSVPGTSPVTARLWDFGDGGSSTVQNPSHTYTTPGNYTVILQVSTAAGEDTESKAFYITVSTPPTAPTANFSADQTTGFVPLAVQFTDLSTNGGSAITSWSWSFGDGGTSTAQSPSHTYTVPGTYTVTLTATNAIGSDGETKTGFITAAIVPVAPVAEFSGTPTSGDAPLTVNFTDLSSPGTSPITTRAWDFGDGGTSTATNPTHTYTAPGTYTVALTVATAVGGDTEAKGLYIQVSVAPTAPTANFTADQTTGFVPLAVQFTDISTNGGSPITSRLWTFGDGSTSIAQNPTHTYSVPGTYDVSLRVTNAVGPDSTTKASYIVAAVVPVAPVAEFTGSPTSGDAPLTVNFTDLSVPGTSPITTWAWTFGDGGTSTAQSPSHTYTAPGSYTVALTVSTLAGGDTEAKGFYVQVSVPPTVPTANFSADQTTGFVPLAVQFTDLSSNGGSTITSWAWAFGDGGTSTAQNPSHSYATPGTYTVTLTATNGVGSDLETKAGYIVALVVPVAPVADFTGTPLSGDAPLTVNFTDASTPGTSPITNRLWDFGDGGTSTAVNPSHTYTIPGTYTVSLGISTAVGDDTAIRGSYVAVSVPPTVPTANFSADQTNGFVPLAVTFTDLSTNGGLPITSWSWTFGDGGTSTAQNPSHTYVLPGSYTVSLTATNAVGSDDSTRTGYITTSVVPVGPVADFTGTPLSGDAPLNVAFTDTSTPGTSPITGRLWDFGDGATSTAANPSHNYTIPGTYTVSLGVSTLVGADTEVKTSYVQVAVPPTAPTANFGANQTSGFVPLAVTFTDQSTNGGLPITSWSWSFGDGATSTLQNPSHSYTVPGVYDVSLRVANAVGPDSTTKSSYITAAVVPVSPSADFTGTPTSGDAPLTVNFTDISTPGTSPINARLWDFGDGATSTLTNPSHTYNTPGSYTVALTVSSTVGGDTESKGFYILVSVPPTVPTANFSADQTNGFVPLAVNFTDLSSSGGSTITGWSWAFGDGGTSTAQNPSHTYTVPGTYTVTLTATNGIGSDGEIKAGYIVAAVVPVPPVAEFSGTPLSGDAPLNVAFTDLSIPGTSPITGRLWDFGDGATSTATNPSHNYTTPGSYSVALTVSTLAGEDTENKGFYITVNVPPTPPAANFTADPTAGFAPLAVNFTDASTNGGLPITSWAWSFGDGGSSAAQNPSHVYATPGTYSVSLKVANAVGPDSTVKPSFISCAVVPVAPVADFTGTPLSGDAPLNVTFTDTSTPGTSPITARLWDFGDGGTSTATNPSHNYTVPGTYTVSLAVSTAAGDDTESKGSYVQVDVPPTAPTANFIADQTNGFVPLVVNFTDQSTNGGSTITSRLWSFGDGGSSTSQNPSHTYTVPGTYNVSLRVANAVGPDSTTKTGYIVAAVVPVGPTADFSGTPLNGDAPLNVAFTDLSTPGTSPITARLWDFGDGATSTATNPSHNYTVPGTYTVSLGVSTLAGDNTEVKTSYVQVDVPPTAPTANFTADQTAGFVPLAVTFTDQSTNGGSTITGWSWNFGDGGTSTTQNPSHTYTVPGTYTVTLTATNGVGSDGETKAGYIVAAVVPVGPTADFTGTPLSGDAPLNVAFTDLSTAGTSPITGRLWDFGDGATSTATNPSHNYTVPGTYTVSLGVSTAVGDNTESKGSYVQVSVPPTAPTANFTADQTNGFAPLAVNFTDQSTNGGSSITSWFWRFGDGATSTLQNPSHTYNTPGSYDVTLRATNSVGPDSTTKADYIVAAIVPVGPTAEFSGTPLSGDAPLNVAFTDLSTAGTSPITGRLWDFGDGATSTATNPSHNYTVPGTYTVSLGVSTLVGDNTETKTAYVQVDVPPTAPTANFSADQTAGFVPLAVTFTDQSTNGGSSITSWFWRFGDGATSTLQNPSHTYNTPGTYDVTLRATNAVGPDSTTKADYIVAANVPVGPTADFSGTPLSGDAPLNVAFTDLSTPGTSPITGRLWDFGDGATSTATNPSHNYTVPGTYTVSLGVSTAAGDNTEAKTSYVTVQTPAVPPVAAFSGTPTSGASPLLVQFTDASTAGTSPISSRVWDFGDGGTSTETDPSHTYTAVDSYTVSLTVTTADGTDSEVKSDYIVVAVPPTVDFSGFPVSGFAPLAVNFTDQTLDGGAGITGWSWDFGDSGTATAWNPSHTFTAPGTYTVTLTATNPAGAASRTKTDFIVVGAAPIPPTAAFSGTPLTGVAPLVVQFTDASIAGSAPISARLWDFGDLTTSIETSPSHTYASPGSYTVVLSLLAEDATEDTEDKEFYVQVLATPVAPIVEFSADVTAGQVPLAVQFTDLSTDGGSAITSRSWTFGDGGTSTATSPGHTYTVPGTYTVALTETNGVGPSTQTKTGYITAVVVPVPPTAAFSGTPTKGGPPLSVQFTDASVAGTSPITGRLWDFGDLTTSTEASPSHSYSSLGSYTVGLTVATADGEDTETKTFFVEVCQPAIAGLTGAPRVGIVPFAVQFQDTSAPAPSMASWLWDFGDGTTSTLQNPLHTYTTQGVYPVSLKVSNSCTEDSVTQTAYVTATDTCPTPTYTIANARWDTITDDDSDGYRSRARLVWNADSDVECPKSVFARIFYHSLGDTVWTSYGESACYTITGNNAGDTRAMFIQDLPTACYEFRVDLYECGGSTLEASMEPVDDPDLSNQCFEPADATSSAELSGTSP